MIPESDNRSVPSVARIRTQNRSLVLVGLMGTGKTTTARILADELGWPLVDSDELIEARTGRTVREIFADEGETAFRALETAAMRDALEETTPSVIAAAGGVVKSADNRRALVESDAMVVWLDADVDVLVQRVTRGTHRPLLDQDPAGALRAMAAERADWYAEVADLRVDTTKLRPRDVANAIIDAVSTGTDE